MTPDEIYDAAMELHALRKTKSREELKVQFESLFDCSDILFNMCMEDSFDSSILKHCVGLLGKRQRGDLDDMQSDVNFGTVLVDKYVPEELRKN